MKRPDPSTYDQKLEITQGRVPTWDSPDIVTHLFPNPFLVPLDSIKVRIRNLSTEASAFNTLVHIFASGLGIGLPRNHLGALNISLSRRGFPGDTREVEFPLPTQIRTLGRFAIFTIINHPHDSVSANNEGEQVLDGRRTSEGGRSIFFDVLVRNPTTNTLSITMMINPIKWSVNISPAFLTLNPDQQQNVRVTLNVPSTIPIGTEDQFDLFATSTIGVLGGVALLVYVDN